MDIQASNASIPTSAATLYGALEERILARDQIGASQAYYDLVRAGRPLPEIIAEGIRIHAPTPMCRTTSGSTTAIRTSSITITACCPLGLRST
jgi:hypothetical protein